MLTLVTYPTRNALRALVADRSLTGPIKIVAPFPGKADALRESWASTPEISVDTIARFTQDLWAWAFAGQAGDPPWRKSRLLLLLNVFKNLHPEHQAVDYGVFKTAYQAFSDLRAYVSGAEIPDEILEHFPVEVAELVQFFHAALNRAGIRDEHAATFELTEKLREPEGAVLPGRPLVILEGFTFLSPAQLSFIEALAIRHEVWVPLPQLVWQSCHDNDWPRVLSLSAKLHELTTSEASEKVLRVQTHPGGSLGGAIRSWRQNNQGPAQIILGAKSPSDGAWQEIPLGDIFTKRPVNVVSESLQGLFTRWEAKLAASPRLMAADALPLWIDEEKKRALEARTMDGMRSYKCALLVSEAVESIPGCLQHQPLNSFFLKLLKEVSDLDSPRNHIIPLLSEVSQTWAFSMREIDGVKGNVPTALCVDGSLGPVKSDHRPHSPEMERALAKLGPIRRPELEFLFLRSELDELLHRAELTVLMEEGLLKHDLAWKEVFTPYRCDPHPMPSNTETKQTADYRFFLPAATAAGVPAKLSASRLQDYLDCPRRYHAKRIAKIIPDVDTLLEVDAMTMGNLEHELVGLAWKKGETWWRGPGQLEAAARELMETHKAGLSDVLGAAVVAEVALYAANGLERLMLVQEALPGTRFEFEVPITALGKSGSIDCLGTGGGAIVLIDFKRSKGQNPSFNKWPEFDKVQLWFYLHALKQMGHEVTDVVAGYFFFKDPEESWLAFSKLDAHPLAEDVLGKLARPLPELAAEIERYIAFESSQIERLSQESLFLPLPRVDQVCDSCQLRPLCPGSHAGDDA